MHTLIAPTMVITLAYVVEGVVKLLGQSECEIEVRENWGLKVVVKDKAGNDHVVWGMELERCSKNPHKRDDPYESERFHAYNRAQLKSMSEGTVVSYPCGNEYQQTKVMRIVRAGCVQRVRYTVPLSRCIIHKQSVKVTKKLIESARKDNRLWGAGIRPPPPSITERHVITPETYNNLRDWIFFYRLFGAYESVRTVHTAWSLFCG